MGHTSTSDERGTRHKTRRLETMHDDEHTRSSAVQSSLQFDRYQRLEALAAQIRALPESTPGFVLDVGGAPGELAMFLPEHHIVVVDLPSAGAARYDQVHADACFLPFTDRCCEVVVSCDVMEHITPDRRWVFVRELFRVSHGWVVLGVPRGAPDVHAAEQTVAAYYRLLFDAPHPWLLEHFQNGLPTREDVTGYLSSIGARHVRFPNGYLKRWVMGMVVNRYLESRGQSDQRLRRFNGLYNASFTDADSCDPAYRDIYVATTNSRRLPKPHTPEGVDDDIGWDRFWQFFSLSQEHADLAESPLPFMTVIVVAYNHESCLESCLTALQASAEVEMEIIVVDNGSDDASARVACRSGALVVRSGENLGFAGAFNLGWRLGSGGIVASVNPDVIVDPWSLFELRQGCLEQKRAAVVGGKLLNREGSALQHAGGVIRENFCTDHIGRNEPPDAWNQPSSVQYVTGAFMAVKRAVLEKAGGLDEGFWPAYYEETDLCVRARQLGYDVLYWPWATARHHEASTLGLESEGFFRAYHGGRLRFTGKHLLPRNAVRFVRAERRFRKNRNHADAEMVGLQSAWKGWWWRLPVAIAVQTARRMVSKPWRD